jgi:Fur family ferric uptake transcriptional regulator
MKSVEQILASRRLRRTTVRKRVLLCFLSSEFALSQHDLEQALPSFDRVTLYRTLKTFTEEGILHKIPDDSGTPRYALCHDCEPHAHRHYHVHFKCIRCEHTECFEHLYIPNISLPEGYEAEEFNLLVQGVCPQCSAHSNSK